jgi:hypothetical protein
MSLKISRERSLRWARVLPPSCASARVGSTGMAMVANMADPSHGCERLSRKWSACQPYFHGEMAADS